MSMRIFSAATLSTFVVAGCAVESGVPEGEPVQCALDGASGFSANCILERTASDRFVIHDPNGGFHRFSFDHDTGVLTIADGAEGIAVQAGADNGIAEFAVGSDRYRLKLDLISSSAQ